MCQGTDVVDGLTTDVFVLTQLVGDGALPEEAGHSKHAFEGRFSF